MSSWFSFGGAGTPAPDAAPKKTPTCKICCACPDERAVRDRCVILRGPSKCPEEIEAFYRCLLKEGFTETQVDALRQDARKRSA